METEHVMHTFAPVYDKKSRVLILGTVPVGQVEREPVLLRSSEKPLLESNGGSMRL